MSDRYAMGFDFGTESVRVAIVSVRDGSITISDGRGERDPAVVARAAIERAGITQEQIVGIGAVGESAAAFGLRAGVPVRRIAATHAIVAGAGVASPSTMVMVINASAHLMMNSRIKAQPPTAITVVDDGFLPGYIGYEAKSAPVGDAMDAIAIEAIAFDLRRICDTLRDAGVPVRRFVATGEWVKKSPLLMQTLADVLDAKIRPAASDEPVLLGTAIHGALAAGPEATGHGSMSQIIHAMAPRQHDLVYRPDLRARKMYDDLYTAAMRGRSTSR